MIEYEQLYSFNLAKLLMQAGQEEEVVFLYKEESIDRRSLKSNVSKCIDAFKNIGISQSDRTILFLNDSPFFIYSFLALLAIGAIPVPVNPRLKAHTAKHILNDSRGRFAVIERDQIANYKSELLSSPYIKSGGLIIQDYYCDSTSPVEVDFTHTTSSDILNSQVPEFELTYCDKKPHSVAFWQYSSGTTGVPKAVQHTQVSMLKSTELFAKQTLGINANDIIYSVPKMFFGYGLGNSFFFPLLTGAKAVLDDSWPSPDRVVHNLSQYQPSIFFAVPAMYNMLLKNDMPEIQKIRICFSAGASLPASIYNSWKAEYGKPILDGIGTTELGHVFLTNTLRDNAPGSTGKPISGYEVKIVDKQGTEVTKGTKGILWVKGPSVSPGYWENPNVNEEKFCDGWYNTGDVFVQLSDESFSYRGRQDDLFKVNARWVVPAEVESIIHNQFPSVKEAVLVKREIDDNNFEPVLFLWTDVTEAQQNGLCNDIRALLTKNLESYKMPKDIFIVSELPRNDNGKLSRRILENQCKDKELTTV